jgi:hypothetical protein
MPVAASATEVLADLGKAVRHQATSGLAFFGEDANESSSHWLAGGKPSKLSREAALTVVWLIFTTPRSPARAFSSTSSSEQVRVIFCLTSLLSKSPTCVTYHRPSNNSRWPADTDNRYLSVSSADERSWSSLSCDGHNRLARRQWYSYLGRASWSSRIITVLL